jgi:glucokinase
MYIGVDLGGTNIDIGLVDNKLKVIQKKSINTKPERGYKEIISDIAKVSKKIIDCSGLKESDITSIGIGIPGTVNKSEGIVTFACNIFFENIPLVKELNKYFNIPIYIDNDANCAALGEALTGAAKDYENSVTIMLGTGVGGGIILNGKIYNGFNGSAGEIGHMVIKSEGYPCNCGRRGCFETLASASALIRMAKISLKDNLESKINELTNFNIGNLNGKIIFDACKLGDKVSIEVVDNYINYLAEGITNIINIFAPEVIVIGGGISKEGEYLLKPLRKKVYKYVYFKGKPQTQIKCSQLGSDAGIIGAAQLAFF